MHNEIISYTATAAAAIGSAATAVVGDSLTIKNNQGSESPRIIQLGARNQTAGFHQLTWPSAHDTTRGYRFNVPATEVDNRMPLGTSMDIEPQETISAIIAATAVAGDVEHGVIWVHYPRVPGLEGRFITWQQLLDRMVRLTTVSATLTGAGAGYTGSELITAESDLLRANTDYAVLGATTSLDCAVLCITSPDFANMRMGVPGDAADNDWTSQWFCEMSRAHKLPLIPVFNSGNKSATTLSFLQDENNISPLVTWFLAQLKK